MKVVISIVCQGRCYNSSLLFKTVDAEYRSCLYPFFFRVYYIKLLFDVVFLDVVCYVVYVKFLPGSKDVCYINLVFLMNLPTLVILGSFFILNIGPDISF